MSVRIRKYWRESLLIVVGILAIYGLPVVYHLLPWHGADGADVFLRISALILFGDVLWYSFSGKRRFLPVLAVAVLSLGMNRALYGSGSSLATLEASLRMMGPASSDGVPVTVFYNLIIVAAGLLIGLLGAAVLHRPRKTAVQR